MGREKDEGGGPRRQSFKGVVSVSVRVTKTPFSGQFVGGVDRVPPDKGSASRP